MQATAQAIAAPDPSEYAPYYGRYITLVGGHDVVAVLEDQPRDTLALVHRLQLQRSPGPGPWHR